jgi:protein TonB
MADFTMVQGNADTYAGGITSSSGTAKSAVTAPSRGPVPGVGAGGGNGAGQAIGAVDQAKTARPIGSDWDCKALFPGTATSDSATVIIATRVRADGTPESVSVIADPGQGFGPAARACAMRQRYDAARDREGRLVTGSTAPFRVRFTR